jgi:hypothetical protein
MFSKLNTLSQNNKVLYRKNVILQRKIKVFQKKTEDLDRENQGHKFKSSKFINEILYLRKEGVKIKSNLSNMAYTRKCITVREGFKSAYQLITTILKKEEIKSPLSPSVTKEIKDSELYKYVKISTNCCLIDFLAITKDIFNICSEHTHLRDGKIDPAKSNKVMVNFVDAIEHRSAKDRFLLEKVLDVIIPFPSQKFQQSADDLVKSISETMNKLSPSY